jgi:hypothetical protein
MNKAEIVRALTKGYELTGKKLPENFEFLPISNLRIELAEFKDSLKEQGFQPNKVVNALKNNDHAYLSSISFDFRRNAPVEQYQRTESKTPQFQKIETKEPGESGEGRDNNETSEPIPESEQVSDEGVKETEFEPVDNDIQKHLSNYNQPGSFHHEEPETEKKTRKKRRSRQPKVDVDGLVTGYLLLFVVNMIVPTLAAFVVGQASSKYEIDANRVKLNEEQLSELRPIADAAADHLQMKINPLVLFGVMTSVMYTGNIVENIKPVGKLR